MLFSRVAQLTLDPCIDSQRDERCQQPPEATTANVIVLDNPRAEEQQQKMVAALMRQIASVRAWYFMTKEHSLSTEEAGVVGSWALERLIAVLDEGELPQIESGG